VLIDSEYIIVPLPQATTTWAGVTRGADGSTAATHLINAPVAQDVTVEAMDNALLNGTFSGFGPKGLPGAVAATRFVGANASGPPVSGTWATGDVATDQSGGLWVCTAAGTPGTWANAAFLQTRHAEVQYAAAQTIPTGVATLITWDTVESNDGNWNVSTHQYTCTLPGRYLVTVLWSWGSPLTTAQNLAAYKNGSSYRVLDTPATAVACGVMRGSAICRAAVNDTLDLRVSQFTGSSQGNGGGVASNWMQIEYVGP
jgi:hypothetical protein